MTEIVEIKEAQEALEATQGEIKYMTAGLEKAEDEVSRLESELSQLEAETPELSAKMVLGEIKPEILDKHMQGISKHRQQAELYKAALPVLETWLEQARRDRQQAEDDLRKEDNWQRFEELKTQLFEKYDEKLLAEARRTANNIERHGPAQHAYWNLVMELQKRNPRSDIRR